MNFKQKFLRFSNPIKDNKKESVKTIFFAIFSSLYGILNVYFIQYFVEYVQSNEFEKIKILLSWYLFFNVFYFAFGYFIRKWSYADIYYWAMTKLQDQYMMKFNTLDNTKIESIGTGKIISILQNGFRLWADYLHSLLNRTTGIMISFIGAVSLIAWVGYIYLIGFLIVFGLTNLVLFFLASKTNFYRKRITEERVKQSGQMVKMIMSKFEIMQNNKSRREVDCLNSYTKTTYELNDPLSKHMYFIGVIPDIVIFFVYVSVLTLFGVLNISIPQMVGIFLIIWVLQATISRSVWIYQAFVSNFYDIEKMWDFYDTTPEIAHLDDGETFVYKNGDIDIQNLTFWYDEKKVFEQINLSITGWQKTAFVGMSGSGKTTLVKLIAWFIKPEQGNILVDHQNIQEVNLRSYYKYIGYLTQDPSVFDGTIYDNLVYGAWDDVSNDDIEKAISLSGSEFIYDFPLKLETQIWERWIRLSWWQRQRLAIAKLFLKDPKIIILDEPTSALDSFLEEKITESFEKLFEGRTVLIIAHRLQTVKDADEIIVIDNGKVIERGNHKTLTAKKWYYKKMLDLQSGF